MTEDVYRDIEDSASIGPLERLELCLDRIAFQDGAIGAMVHVDVVGARQAAGESNDRWRRGAPLSALDGVPIVVKANIAVSGWPLTGGAQAYAHRLASRDAACVANLRRAGAVIIGLAAMHEIALGATSDNPWSGRTFNPHRPGFTAGGSSGGSAAAVAAGYCDGALGTDTIGSVRIPAAYCGIFGFKPGRDVIPLDGVIPLSSSLDHVGVFGRSADMCRLLAAAAAADISPVQGKTLAGLKIAILDWGGIADVQPAIAAAYAGKLAVARDAGAALTPVRLDDYPFVHMQRLLLIIAEAEGATVHAAALRDRPDMFSPDIRNMLTWGATAGRAKLPGALRELQGIASATRSALAPFDALLLPATSHTAFSSDSAPPADQAIFMTLASGLGLPAAAFPIGSTADGLPLSAQVVAWKDDVCMGIAQALGRAL